MIAILDFGTNTFNLLIAEKLQRSFKIIHTSKQPAKLGKGGIQHKRISREAFERGFTAIQNHMETIKDFEVSEIRAFATSAIRNASNGQEFVDEVQRRFGFRVRVIPGEREAELIFKGVRQSVDLDDRKAMILDIGGGSNEFIICEREGIRWKQSFELGMARIIELFPMSDPITHEEIQTLEDYFRHHLQALFEAVKKEKPGTLIGASGSFDTISAIRQHLNGITNKDRNSLSTDDRNRLSTDDRNSISTDDRNGLSTDDRNRLSTDDRNNLSTDDRNGLAMDNAHSREIPLREFRKIHRLIVRSTLAERKAMPGMEPVRVEMIVGSVIFINFILRECHIKHLIHSDFALKEGVIAELVGI